MSHRQIHVVLKSGSALFIFVPPTLYPSILFTPVSFSAYMSHVILATSGKVSSISKVDEALLFVLFLGRKGVRMYHVANTVVGFAVDRI